MKNFSKKFNSLAFRTPRWFKKSAREKLSKDLIPQNGKYYPKDMEIKSTKE